MLKEFKDFAMRGNVMDLAIAVIIGGAFGKIIASLVNDVLMPLIGLLLGGVTFSELSGTVNGVDIMYGLFIQAIVDFIIVAFVVFMLVRTMNNMKKQPAPSDPTTKECPYCFTAVPIKATRCPHCTSQL
jgi:large conductance mechanosensitive channel